MLGPVLWSQRTARTVAARLPTRHRHWRRVGSRAAIKIWAAGELWNSFLPSSLFCWRWGPVTCKSRQIHQAVGFNSFLYFLFMDRFFFVYRSAVSFGFSFSVSGGGGAVGVDGCAAAGGWSVQRRAGRCRRGGRLCGVLLSAAAGFFGGRRLRRGLLLGRWGRRLPSWWWRGSVVAVWLGGGRRWWRPKEKKTPLRGSLRCWHGVSFGSWSEEIGEEQEAVWVVVAYAGEKMESWNGRGSPVPGLASKGGESVRLLFGCGGRCGKIKGKGWGAAVFGFFF